MYLQITNIFYLFTDWESIYEFETQENYHINHFEKNVLNEGNNYVLKCYFEKFVSNTAGGAVDISKTSKNLFEFCIFDSNYVYQKNGGAINVMATPSSSVIEFAMNHCYGIKCASTGPYNENRGNFIYSFVSEEGVCLNEVKMTSMTMCSKDVHCSLGGIFLYYGKENMDSNNASKCLSLYFPSFYYNKVAVESSVKFCSITNNTSSEYSMIKFLSLQYRVEYSSFIENEAGNRNGFFECSAAIVSINYCIILRNQNFQCFHVDSGGIFIITNTVNDNSNPGPSITITKELSSLSLSLTFLDFKNLYLMIKEGNENCTKSFKSDKYLKHLSISLLLIIVLYYK